MPSVHSELRSPEEAARADATEMRPGYQLGQQKVLEVVERIGEGGMGKIFKAFDPVMDRYVALKVLKLDVPDHVRERFRREAVIAANFSHPNLPRVLDRGCVPGTGVEWMTMEYLRGSDLGRVVERGRRVALPVIANIFSQTLDALEYIHARQIAHCDVKPDNIFVTRDPYDRRIVIVKLIDFGVCRNVAPPIEKQTVLVGDPCYMAPEQTVLGAEMDQRVDLYALGLSLYEAVVGRHPFEHIEDTHALIRLQRTHDIPMPTQVRRDLAGPVGEAVDAVVATACAKDPARRYSDAASMRAAINAWAEIAKQ